LALVVFVFWVAVILSRPSRLRLFVPTALPEKQSPEPELAGLF
jgi:hypothetical protein